MTLNDLSHAKPATGPGDALEYDIAAALAAAAGRLADAVDDNRPGWLDIAVNVGDLLTALVTARLNAALDGIYARACPGPAAGTGPVMECGCGYDDCTACAGYDWACQQCSLAFFGPPPGDGMCPACRPADTPG